MEIPVSVKEFIFNALQEDIGNGDITTLLIVPDDDKSEALLISKGKFVVAGLPFAREVFSLLAPDTVFEVFREDGTMLKNGDIIAKISGWTKTILVGERVCLNILQRLSGIATLTSSFVSKVRGLNSKIVDTRKTTPCMRYMEKYAVRMGGGSNHRFGLFDGILIKDNHIEAVGSIAKAVKKVKAGGHYLTKIEVEVENLNDFKEAVAAGADIVMLDNMSVEEMRKAVKLGGRKVITEASGNVSLENVRQIAETGVNLISIGALTHSAPAADISLKLIK